MKKVVLQASASVQYNFVSALVGMAEDKILPFDTAVVSLYYNGTLFASATVTGNDVGPDGTATVLFISPPYVNGANVCAVVESQGETFTASQVARVDSVEPSMIKGKAGKKV